MSSTGRFSKRTVAVLAATCNGVIAMTNEAGTVGVDGGRTRTGGGDETACCSRCGSSVPGKTAGERIYCQRVDEWVTVVRDADDSGGVSDGE